MRRRALELALLAALLAVAPGCRYGRAVTRSFGALVSSPRKVQKNRHPVKPDARLAVVWVGHATAVVQIDDKVILTDPVFTSAVGQLSKRLVEPGVDPDDLPPIDAVLISHDHYDHLSLGSLDLLRSRIRTLLMPPGGTAYLTDFSFPAYELRAWETWSRDGLRVTATPVSHRGGRYGVDSTWMERAFTGYVIEYHGLKVYFGGDTAYDQARFVDTGQRFRGIDLALLPIAPIEPHDFMRQFHMDPPEALQAFLDLGAKRMVPIHFDTFINSTDDASSTDDPGDASRALDRATRDLRRRYDLGSRVIAPLAIGERRVFVAPGEGPKAEEPKPPAEPKAREKEKKEKDEDRIPDEDRLD